MTTALWDLTSSITKFDVVQKLKEMGIASRPYFSPLSSLKAYEGAIDTKRAQEKNHVSYDICSRGVNLPSGGSLTKENAKYTIQSLEALLHG
jgi:perosamine synthetase